jgi:hypothetical protein
MPLPRYTPSSWYWIISNSSTQVFSSSSGTIVNNTDATYQSWLKSGYLPSRISSLWELYDVLLNQAYPQWLLAVPTFEQNLSLLTPDQVISLRQQIPLQITSNANPTTLSGNYPIDPSTQTEIKTLASGINANKHLPQGATAFGISDVFGTIHNFGSSDIINLAEAIEDYIFQLYATKRGLLAGQTVSWPTPSMTIA